MKSFCLELLICVTIFLQVSYHKGMIVLYHNYQYVRGKLADCRIVFFLPQCFFRCKSVAILTHKKV